MVCEFQVDYWAEELACLKTIPRDSSSYLVRRQIIHVHTHETERRCEREGVNGL
jgi:hypothetical protein